MDDEKFSAISRRQFIYGLGLGAGFLTLGRMDRAKDAQGLKDYLADAVIIASGGYAGNGKMLESFVDPGADTMMVRGLKTNTGDGLAMAREAGAMWVAMGGVNSLHVAAVSPENVATGNPARAIPHLVSINKEGKRYVDESLGYVANGIGSNRSSCSIPYESMGSYGILQ